MKQLTEEDVIKTVRESLAKHARKGWEIEILERGVRREDDWWYIPVRPFNQTRRPVEYYDMLASVEGELQDEMELNILLVPTGPDEK